MITQERVMKRVYISTAFSAIAFAGMVDSALATTVYRWTDDRGTVNYSNERPKGRAPKDLHVIEDRVSVYTPEKLPERIRYIPTPAGTAPPQWYGSPASTVPFYDPCLNTPGDPNCYATGVYGARALGSRSRFLAQPQFAPGAIAGNIAGPNAFIAGQSATAQTPTPLARGMRSEPSASFTLPPRAHGSRR